MSVAANVLFWVGTAFILIAFGCSIAWNFVKEKAQKVLHWVITGTTLVSFVCYILYELMK